LKIGSAATPPHVVTPERTGGERRHIVILFSDVVGSSTIANKLDPEEWRELLADYQSATDQAIERFGGHVARFIGDGVLAYFGWPMSHENDGERAVRSAVAILERMAERNQVARRRGKPLLNVRIALHLGEVVLSPSGEVYGDAPNVAARLQASAEPDTILITEPIYRLVRQHVVAEDLGDQLMKGFATPTHVYRVVELADVGRGTARSPRPDTVPFVGRTQELDTLMQRWSSALDGQGQLVMIEGEPGIGKSRLLREFQARLSGQDHYWLEGGCSEFFVNTPFFPVVRFLNSLFSASGLRPSPDDMARLRHVLAAVGIETDETVSLIGELIGVAPVAAAADQQTVAQNRKALLTALVAWIVALAQRKPTVIALEDAQWADPSTLELISAICEQIGSSQILIVMTARQMPKLTHRATVSECRIGVGRLRNEHVLEIARAVIGTLSPEKRDSDAEIILDVANRAEGVPLFAEEVARLVAARDAEGRETRVPVGLIILLSARLDQLGAAKEIAQVAAVIGHEFSYDLIRAVVSISDRRLASLLATLVDAKIVVETGTVPTSSYLFRHRLIQDAAYEGLLRSERRELHRRIADVITKQFPELAEARPETLARHWTSAAEFHRAVDAWLLTAQKATARGAYEEARGAYYEALDCLTQQDGPRDEARELQIRRALVLVLQMTRGYSAAETMEAERQARALVEALGDPRKALARIGSEWGGRSRAPP
jgi:class 3 adenylate cyclase